MPPTCDWQDRAHFFAICARVMRRILIEAARARIAHKRGGDALRVTFDEALPSMSRESEFVAIDEALTALSGIDERKARVVELRFFGGLSVEETRTYSAFPSGASIGTGGWPVRGCCGS